MRVEWWATGSSEGSRVGVRAARLLREEGDAIVLEHPRQHHCLERVRIMDPKGAALLAPCDQRRSLWIAHHVVELAYKRRGTRRLVAAAARALLGRCTRVALRRLEARLQTDTSSRVGRQLACGGEMPRLYGGAPAPIDDMTLAARGACAASARRAGLSAQRAAVDAGAAEDSPSFCCDVDPPGWGTNACRRTDDGRLQVAQAPVNAATAALWEGMWRCPESRRED